MNNLTLVSNKHVIAQAIGQILLGTDIRLVTENIDLGIIEEYSTSLQSTFDAVGTYSDETNREPTKAEIGEIEWLLDDLDRLIKNISDFEKTKKADSLLNDEGIVTWFIGQVAINKTIDCKSLEETLIRCAKALDSYLDLSLDMVREKHLSYSQLRSLIELREDIGCSITCLSADKVIVEG